MIRLTNAQLQPIGLDIGHDSVKMLQLERAGDSLAVSVAARQAFGPEVRAQAELQMPAAIEVIRQLLRRHPFHGRHVVAAVPRQMLYVKNLRLPQIPAAELPSVIQFEAKNVLPFDPAEGQVHFLPAGEVRQGTEVRLEVILLAAKNEDIRNFLESLNAAGVVVASIDVEACALYRGIERFIRRRQDEQEVYVLADLGYSRTQVVIGRGREISFVKAIDLGGRHCNDAVARKLGISVEEAQALRRRLHEAAEAPETQETASRDPVRQAVYDAARPVLEDLAREISLCLRYYSVTFRGQRPSRVQLMGGEATDPQLRDYLNRSLIIPAEISRPLAHIDTSQMKAADRRGSMSEWALALGLGLKTIAGGVTQHVAPGESGPAPRSAAEVVDVNQAVAAVDAPAAPSPTAAPARGPVPVEAARA